MVVTWDDFATLATDHAIPLLGLPLLGVVVGAWLSNSVFPFRLKRREWRWEKETWARETFFETVSRIAFIADHYLKGEYEDRFSMSSLDIHGAESEIVRLVKELHFSGHKIKLYLDKSNARVFEQYLRDSQLEYNVAKESWGQWNDDDDIAVVQHTEEAISGQGRAASNALANLKLCS